MISVPFKTAQDLDFLRVYLITDLQRIGKDRFLSAVEEALEGGVRAMTAPILLSWQGPMVCT
jgi:hypothetical protein